MSDHALLQLHLAPLESVEVYELTGALSALAKQYDVFIREQNYVENAGKARLLISSVSPGSIDINFVPDLASALSAFAPMISDVKVVSDFAGHIKALLEKFQPKKDHPGPRSDVTVRDCDDAINIVKPIAEHGGSQTFNIFRGPVVQNILTVEAPAARRIVEEAVHERARLQYPQAERKQRVSMIWKRLDRDPAKTQGSSPDKALIDEIDPKPKPIFFADELSYLKREMIENEDNPYQKVYFVDVEVSRVRDRVTAYRIVGFHGKDEIENDADTSLEDSTF